MMEIPAGAEPGRLDRWLAQLSGLSRAAVRESIDAGAVYLDGRRCRVSSRTVGPGALLRIERRDSPFEGRAPAVLFRDRYLVVIDKPAGMAVQATRGGVEGTLEAWLRAQEDVLYTAFHHRLDRDAQGLICAALDRAANKGLAASFSQRMAERQYRVLVHGCPDAAEGEWRHRQVMRGRRRKALAWEESGEGESMESRWSLVERRGPRSLLGVSLVTGRTHQVRLQAAAEGHPIVGDRLYGFAEGGGLRLQACALALDHPVTREPLAWSLDEPQGWSD